MILLVFGSVVAVVVAVVAVVAWGAWHRALDRQARRDQLALDACRFGSSFRVPALGRPHDQARAAVAAKRALRTDTQRRKAAAARTVLPDDHC